MLSRQLAQIEMNAPVTLDMEEAKLAAPAPFVGNKGLIEKFKEVGFRTLLTRVEGKESKQKKLSEKVKEDQLKLV